MKALIFSGTTGGMRLADLLLINGIDITVCVSAEYGNSVIPKNAGLKILAKCLEPAEMAVLLDENKFDYVIDATHPYANIVTADLKAACTGTRTEYLRLIPDESNREQSVVYVDNAAQAASFIKGTTGNVLMAIGSRELDAFTAIEDYSARLFVHIVPMTDSLQRAINLGFKSANIICMQGPFEIDMNAAMLKMTNASYMVTKDSGKTGDFSKKLTAAKQTGCKVIAIAKPIIETGYTLKEILGFFNIRGMETAEHFTYFPLFINMNGKKIAVIGGGKIAERRIKILLAYNADITVVSPCITDSIQKNVLSGAVKHIDREYESTDISGAFLVIAATNNRDVNHAVMNDAKKSGILSIISDNRAECDCYFPAITENGEFVAGIVSKNGNHTGLKKMAQEMRWFLNHE